MKKDLSQEALRRLDEERAVSLAMWRRLGKARGMLTQLSVDEALPAETREEIHEILAETACSPPPGV